MEENGGSAVYHNDLLFLKMCMEYLTGCFHSIISEYCKYNEIKVIKVFLADEEGFLLFPIFFTNAMMT